MAKKKKQSLAKQRLQQAKQREKQLQDDLAGLEKGQTLGEHFKWHIKRFGSAPSGSARRSARIQCTYATSARSSKPRSRVAPHRVYRLRLALREAPYPLWRELLVDAELDGASLLTVLLLAMGWQIYHPFVLVVGMVGYTFGEFLTHKLLPLDSSIYGLAEGRLVDAAACTVADIFAESRCGLLTYDMDGRWVHEVEVLEEVPNCELRTPYCVRGEGACPPEDIGGSGAFAEMLRALYDPSSEDRLMYREWLGAMFNPDELALSAVNRRISR